MMSLMFKKASYILFALFLIQVSLSAQGSATASTKLTWDQATVTLAEANSYSYLYYLDASTTGIQLNLVTCTGTTNPYTCQSAFPAITPGSHTLLIKSQNVAGLSTLSSNEIKFTFVILPAAPSNLRIVDAFLKRFFALG